MLNWIIVLIFYRTSFNATQSCVALTCRCIGRCTWKWNNSNNSNNNNNNTQLHHTALSSLLHPHRCISIECSQRLNSLMKLGRKCTSMNLEQRDIRTCDANSAALLAGACMNQLDLLSNTNSFSITASSSQLHDRSLFLQLVLNAHPRSSSSLLSRAAQSQRWNWCGWSGNELSSNHIMWELNWIIVFMLSYISPCDAIMCCSHLQGHRQMYLKKKQQHSASSSQLHHHRLISVDYTYSTNTQSTESRSTNTQWLSSALKLGGETGAADVEVEIILFICWFEILVYFVVYLFMRRNRVWLSLAGA